MAGVFLSYDRRDNKRAGWIARALEKAGHSVWWDLHVRGGAQFAKVIEEALRQADVVVVLWSANSVESAWVRDEATAGRDTGRLIPVALDGTEPPLGFRQYQTIDLARWSGRGTPEGLRTLLHAIDELAPSSPGLPPTSLEQPKSQRWRPAGWMGAAGLAVVAVAGLSYWQPWTSKIPTVAVASAKNSPADQELARDLMVSLDGLSAARADSMRLLDSAESGRPDLRFEVGSVNDEREIGASVVLTDGRDRSVIWSRNFRQPAGNAVDLKQQLSFTVGRVLSCALEALSATPKLRQATVKLYLTACARSTEVDDPRTIAPIFRNVVEQAPQFVGGWRGLLLVEAAIVGTESYPESEPTAPMLRSHIKEARKLDPALPEASVAELYLLSGSSIDRQMDLLTRAVAQHPDHATLNQQLGVMLSVIGRQKEAVGFAKRASELDPLDPEMLGSYVTMLGWTGQKEAALNVLGSAEKRWPGSSSVLDARWRYHLRFGDPREALRLMQSGAIPPSGLESYVRARIDPSPANIKQAISDAEAQAKTGPRAIGILMQTLGEFGREDQIYDRLLNGPAWDPSFVNQALFRPALRNFRRDPRMMLVAKKSGLVDYWMKSGRWPDFCSEPDLPYDCREEAAKLSARA